MTDIAPSKPAPNPSLSLQGISRHYGDVQALNDISFDLAEGEILCLLGASGCGKSTLLRLIAGIEDPDRGEIRLAGQLVSDQSAHVEPEARGIGFMFQDYALFPHLSVADNVAFGLKGWSRAETRARVSEMLDMAGISALADRFPHMLSGGESQRVALARALAPRPGLLLMDEPFSNLDQGLRATVRAETLSLLHQMRVGTIIVTHDPQEALAVADRIVLIRDGRIEAMGTPRGLYNDPPTAYTARFLGPGTGLPGRIQNGNLVTPLGQFAAPGLQDGQSAEAFFRPQALSLCAADQGGYPARVLRREFLGAQDRLTLALEDTADTDCSGIKVQLDLPAASVDQATASQQVDHLGLRLDPAAVHIFATGPQPEAAKS
ncbi:ABC transporter ATP-binding protein [Rhodalgimonas zhirmunskyi]|uniref:ABC transporter ATP-binding protein n=1 Tax=Rhodalgimonas zhirmunskyi TaxID=2964767 RepID=A0AAJ1UGA5_9RHOB|nr:ABC transporter ATP-binding protein [Rhodoalgimonas zhirmunskyi]MDQ2095546.1 ABC transporter ATP-binding protein [Rhodoalgimonas zhirmunskyi]